MGLGFELMASSLSHISSPFCYGYFVDRVSQTIFPGWAQTMILPISASQEARIIGTSHQCPPYFLFIYFAVLVIQPKAVRNLEKHSTIELHPQPGIWLL
jgi:hypothetical protein